MARQVYLRIHTHVWSTYHYNSTIIGKLVRREGSIASQKQNKRYPVIWPRVYTTDFDVESLTANHDYRTGDTMIFADSNFTVRGLTKRQNDDLQTHIQPSV